MSCIPKHLTQEFLRRIKSGEITPEGLMDMTSEQRVQYFSDFLGEANARNVVSLLESKMLLRFAVFQSF